MGEEQGSVYEGGLINVAKDVMWLPGCPASELHTVQIDYAADRSRCKDTGGELAGTLAVGSGG